MPKFMRKNAYIFIYPMLTIAVIGIFKYLYINFSSIMLAFSTTNEFGEQVSTLANFEKLFAEFATPNSGMLRYLGNTLQFFIMYNIKTLVSFSVAYFLFKKIWGYRAFRIIFYIPSIVSPIIFVNVWRQMFEFGGIADIIYTGFTGLEYVDPLKYEGSAMLIILIYSFWGGFGTSLLMFVGAMNRVPSEVLDAGLIDGCGMAREFFNIMIPLTWETLSTMLLLTSMSLFTATGPILYFTQGAYNTETISFWIFFKTMGGEYNYPTAVGMFFTILALPLVAFGRWLMNRVNSDITY